MQKSKFIYNRSFIFIFRNCKEKTCFWRGCRKEAFCQLAGFSPRINEYVLVQVWLDSPVAPFDTPASVYAPIHRKSGDI